MFLDAFAHPDGRARFLAVDHRGPAEVPDGDYPVHLTTGRVLAQYQSGAQTRRVRDLPDTGPFVELHPMLAGRIGAVDGEPVTVATRRGTMTAPGARGGHDPARHRLRALPLGGRQPAHQRRARPGVPDAGVQGVRGGGERMIEGMRERLVVVGGGMAAVRLVEELCSRGYDGAVTVLADEDHAPYNRILLSAVLEGTHGPDALTLRSAAWFADRGVDLRLGARVLEVDRDAGEVMLVDGERLGYDRLVLATGSIPTLPPIRGLVRRDGSLHPQGPRLPLARRLPAPRRRGRSPPAERARRGRRRPARPPGRPGAHGARAWRRRWSRAPRTCWPPSSAPPAAGCWPATCAGSGPRSTPARGRSR